MSNYIAAFFVLILVVIFPVQYGLQIVNHHTITGFQSIVETAKEEAKQDGYFTPEGIEKMKSEITASYKDVKSSEIVVNVTTVPKYRTDSFDKRELISYEVGVPIDKIMAGGGILGIPADENRKMYYVHGQVASEKIIEDEI